MSKRRCIQERFFDGEKDAYSWIWHIIPKGGGPNEDCCSIACSDVDYIVFPGYPEWREPTCEACLAL